MMSSRTGVEQGFKQYIDMSKLDGSNLIELTFWAKLSDELGSNTVLQDLKGHITCEMQIRNFDIQAVVGCSVAKVSEIA